MYDKFKNRMIKLMKFKNFFLKHISVFIASFVLIILFSGTLIYNVGHISLNNSEAINITYGDKLSLDLNSFMSKVNYEYSEDDKVWNEDLPIEPGEYRVRAKSKTLFNQINYTKPVKVNIKPKDLEVNINESVVSYGDNITLNADLCYNDKINDARFTYTVNKNEINVMANKEDVVIKNGDKDVTHCYNIIPKEKTLNYVKRELYVRTKSINRTYNGLPFDHKETEIVKGRKAFNDELVVSYSIDEVKDVIKDEVNTATFKMINSLGEDVTRFYNIIPLYGTINVEPRKVNIVTSDAIKLEDGSNLSNKEFRNSNLVSSHTISVKNNSVLSKPGTIKNELEFDIFDENGNSVINNYSLNIKNGLLTICPKIIITTNSNSKEYDDTFLFDMTYTIDKDLPYNHHLKVENYKKVKDAGKYDNILNIKILDDKNNDITHIYNPKMEYGILEIIPRSVNLTSNNDQKMYDGLSFKDVTFTTDRLLKHHKVKITNVYNLESDVGIYQNKFDFEVLDDNGKNIDFNYDITPNWQSKEIYKRSVKIKGQDASKIYDAKPIKHMIYDILDYGLVLDHKFVIKEDFAEFINPDSYTNLFKLKVVDQNGNDVDKNYELDYDYGTVHISKRPLYIDSDSVTHYFDRKPVYAPHYTLRKGANMGIVNGHTFVSNNDFKSFTKVGEYDNDFTFKILDDSIDVTDNYIVKGWGKIIIKKYEITITTGSSEKVYDGTPLTNGYCDVQMKFDHDIKVQAHTIGTITYVGSVENDVYYKVLDKQGNDITEFYALDDHFGTLTIKKRNDGQLISGTGSIETSGEIAQKHQNVESINNLKAFTFNSNCKDKIYFRAFSFGDYNMTKWEPAVEYKQSPLSPLYFTSKTIDNYQSKNIDIYLTEKLDYLLPYFTENGPSFAGDSSNAFKQNNYNLDFLPYVYDYRDNMSIPSMYKDLEQAYYKYVLNTYLQLPQSTRKGMEEIIASGGLNKNSPNIILEVQNFMRNSAVLNNNFKDYPKDADYALYLLTDAREGNTQHFATTATCLYRALGIPARYTVGFVSDPNPNTNVDVPWENCRAWVEVYIKGMGWVNTEVSGRVVDTGDGQVIPPLDKPGQNDDAIILKPVDVAKIYDNGRTFKAVNELDLEYCEAFSELLENGYSYEVKVTGSRSSIGQSNCYITDFKLYDISHHDVTNEFKFKKLEGTIMIVEKMAEFRIESKTKYYDGQGYSLDNSNAKVILPQGYSATYNIHGELNKIGVSYAKIDDLVIKDENGNIDTDIYVHTVGGKLTIKKIPIEITIASDVKEYDGTPLKNNKYWLSSGKLLDNHSMNVIIDKEITDIGQIYNIPSSIKIFDKNNNSNVKFAYDIKVKQGILQIL